MKNPKQKLKNILLLFASLILVSCSDDLYDHEIQKNDSGYKITDKSFEELRKDKKFMKAFGEINSSGNSTSKTVMEQNYNFTISDIPAKVIEKNGKTSYTFHIVRDTVNNDYFENLIVGSDSLNQTTAYIAKYKKDFTKPSLINNVPFTKITVNSIVYNNNPTGKVTECIEKVYSLCNGIPYDCGGSYCGFASFTLCSGSSGSSDSGSGVSWGGGGTSTTPVGGGSSTNMENFYSGLQFQQQHWLDEQTSETQQSIFNYLNTNGFTTANKNFIKTIINLSIDLDINAMEIWNNQYDNFRNGMSVTERVIFDNLLMTRRLSYMVAAKKAFDKANELYPNSSYNGKGDAYRHTLWNALTSLLIGSDLANQLTTAHEEKPFEYQYHYKEKDMDLYNNQKGRNIATFSNLSTVFENVQTALNVGSLMYLNNLEINTRKATQNSNLTPTNQ